MNIPDIMSHGSLLALPLALIAGTVAGLNPCCVALYPSAVAVCCGVNAADACGAAKTQSWGVRSSIAFLLGIAAATTALGIIAALAGQIVGQLGSGVRYIVAAVPLVMGLICSGGFTYHLTRCPICLPEAVGLVPSVWDFCWL
jgi:cytochrome c biogenesis protein CcdA